VAENIAIKMDTIRRKKCFRLIALIALFLLVVQLVTAQESDSTSSYELKEEELSADIITPIEASIQDSVDLKEDSTVESTIVPEPIVNDTPGESDNMEAVIKDDIVPIDDHALTETTEKILNKDEEEDNVIIEAAVSSLGESVSSKLSIIADRIKGLTLSKQNTKKIVAFGLGAWGAVTGVGWAMQNFGVREN